MRRIAAALVPLALLTAAAPAAAGDVPLRARLAQCTTGETAEQRAATFTASIPKRRGAERLQLRFTLLQRLAGERRYHVVRDVPGWRRWETSEPGRPGLILTRRVEGLAAPASYRAIVRFRWIDAGGEVLRRTARTTRPCVQPDPRPELRLRSLAAAPEGEEGARYRLELRNEGRSLARAFAVVLVVNGERQPAVMSSPIGSGGSSFTEVVAPPCRPGTAVEIVLDAYAAIAEVREDDNVVRRGCPLS